VDLFGAPAFGQGEVLQAVVIDGANDYGRVSPSGDLDLGANPGLTIEMWMNPLETGCSAAKSFGNQ